MSITVSGRPLDFALQPGAAALLVIDRQRGFIEAGGFGSALGNDVGRLLPRGEPGCDIVPELATLAALTQALGARTP